MVAVSGTQCYNTVWPQHGELAEHNSTIEVLGGQSNMSTAALKDTLDSRMCRIHIGNQRYHTCPSYHQHLLKFLWRTRDIVESTPYGHNMDKEGNYIVHSQPPEALAVRESHVMFKDYDYPTGDTCLPSQKKKAR